MPTSESPHPSSQPLALPLTVLVDDVRGFRDERPALVARSSQEALTLLQGLEGQRIDDLWLDHDLVGDDTIRPVVEWMVEVASTGSPLNVAHIHVHSSNVSEGLKMCLDLGEAGYSVTRSYAIAMWVRAC